MTWYTASVVTAVRTAESQDRIPVFEDFYLLQASSRADALVAAELIGRELAELNEELTYEGKAATRVFLGIRKLRSVYNPSDSDVDAAQPGHGTELTHSFYEVQDIEAAKKLAAGGNVRVDYLDDSD